MKTFYNINLSLILAMLISTITIAQVVVLNDDFETYTVGQQLAYQNPTDWTTWSGAPGSATEDPLISNAYSYSGSNSVVIKPNNDLVRLHGQLTSGICNIGFQIYIPTGKSGYFNSLNKFVIGAPNANQKWAFECYFNTGGVGSLKAAGSTIPFTYTNNAWHPVQLIVDLDLDSAQLWIDGTKIYQWQWTKGYDGAGGYPLELDATDIFGAATTDSMYVDNFLVTSYPTISSTLTGGDWNTPSTWSGNIVPSASDPVKIVNGATITLSSNISRSSRIVVNGTLNCETNVISGIDNFFLLSGANLVIGSASGITTSGSSGNIQMSGTRSFSSAANYIYNGTTAQSTGNGLPATVNNLTINNSTGVTLSNSALVSNALTMMSGNILLNGKTLTLGSSVSAVGTLSWDAGFLTGSGTFKRWFSISEINLGDMLGLFPMGNGDDNRSVWIAGTPTTGGTMSVQHTDAIGTTALSFVENLQTFDKRANMSWTLSNANGFAASSLSLRIQGTGLTGIDAVSDLNICISSGVAGGTYSAPSGSTADPQVNRTGLTAANLINTFYFASTSAFSLPVELTAFSASIIDSKVNLSWATATEVNNFGFEVLRQAQDDKEWIKLGFVNGNGNSNSPKNYSFIDSKISSGKYSYRLKQIDNDGQFEYSKTIEVSFGALNKFELSQNYPNPFNPATTIQFNLIEAENVKLTIYDILGQEIITLLDEYKESGVYTINFNASELNSGVYVYRLEAGNFVQTRKMTLVK